MDPKRGRPAERGTVEDRRQATVMFADLSGFTATSRLMDPEDLKDAVNECFEAIERVVLHYGGTIDKYIGDAVMARFGAPSALEHAPQNAINAAIAIRASIDAFAERGTWPVRIGVHIGINTGLVAAGAVGGEDRRDYTVMGEAVNLASRLQNAASDGQIFVGEATYKAARREFQFRQHALKLKGYDQPVPAYEVLATEENRYRTRPQGNVTGGRSPLVGRKAELNTIAHGLDVLLGGTGGIFAIVGENGMGKSRLLAEAMALPVARELEIVEGRCSAVGSGLAFHPFVDLIKTWAGANESDDSRVVFDLFSARSATLPLKDRSEVIGAAARLLGVANEGDSDGRFVDVEGEALERIIHLAVADLLRALAADRPLLVIIEDLHWADQASLDLLESLLVLARSSRVGFLLLCRPQYAETTERTISFLDRELADRRTTLRLSPLSTAATSELVANLAGTGGVPPSVQTLIAERTEGNPFYVEEVVRSLAEKGGDLGAAGTDLELPATIEEVILSRVDRVEPDAKRVLQIAAVAGRRFPRDLVAELVGEVVDVDAALESLVARELLEPVSSRRTALARVVSFVPSREFVFKHALIQEAVYGSILRKTRRELHAECARSIERRFEDHLHDAYGMLAYHYLRADVLEKAEEYTLAAGELAARTAASHEALRYFREAYRLYQVIHGDNDDKPKRALLEKNIGQALFNTGNLSESVEHFDAALGLYGIHLPGSSVARWAKFGVDLGGLLVWLYAGKHRGGKRGTLEDHAVLEVLYNRARAENPTDPERYVFDTIAAARYVQKLDPQVCAQACEITATTGAFFAFGGLSINVARRFLDEAVHLVREPGSADEFSLKAMGTVVEFHAGDWSSRYDIDDALMDTGLRAGKLWAADTYLGMVAERRYRQGRFDEAAADIAKLRALRLEYGYDFAASAETAQTAFALLERGDLVEAARHMRAYYEMRREDGLHVLALSGLAKIESLTGKHDAAGELLARAATLIAHAGRLAPFYMGAYWTSRLLYDTATVERKQDRATVLAAKRSARRAIAVANVIARERPEALRLSARLATALGKQARALDLCGRAFETAEKLSALPEVSRVCHEVASCLERSGTGARFREHTATDWRSRGDEIASRIGLVGARPLPSPAPVSERPEPPTSVVAHAVRGNGK